jgi:Fur family ferric uptake transcriptional regulator
MGRHQHQHYEHAYRHEHDSENADSTISLLRANNLRATPQRVAVLQAMQSAPEHRSFEQIAERARQSMPGLSVSTVYRTLDSLERAHLVRRSDLGGHGVVYHRVDHAEHFHLICHCCGHIVAGQSAQLAQLIAAMYETYRFTGDVSHQVFLGHCEKCSEALEHGTAEDVPS